jgi:transposase
LFKDLRQDHTAWVQRVQAVMFHHGVAAGKLDDPATRRRLQAGIGLSAAGRQAVLTGLRVLDGLDAELAGLRRQITAFARRQPGCVALHQQFGAGAVTATAIWSQPGDTRRFSASRKAVRYTGLGVTVCSSGGKRSPGHLSRQGSPLLRWALLEAGKCAARPASPGYACYTQVRQRCGGNRAALPVARKITRRSHHILRELGERVLTPV